MQQFAVSASSTDFDFKPWLCVRHFVHSHAISTIACHNNLKPCLCNDLNVLKFTVSNGPTDKYNRSRLPGHYYVHVVTIPDSCPYVHNR